MSGISKLNQEEASYLSRTTQKVMRLKQVQKHLKIPQFKKLKLRSRWIDCRILPTFKGGETSASQVP